MTRRSIDAIKGRANALADAFEDYDPRPGDQNAPLPPVMAVKLAAWRRDTAERELAQAVQAARQQRLSWREVGAAIGTSGEAARQRYGISA
jgi:FAD/FMN-containing dehydrogenase